MGVSPSDKIMMEGEGPDPEVYKAFQKDTLQEVLLTYFRILKSPDNAKLIHVVLEGLAQFGHLLNSHIIIDLLQILKEIMQTSTLSMESTLQCVLASFRLMHVSPEKADNVKIVSSIINIDENLFITKLYEIRFAFIQTQNYKYIPDYLECIDVSEREGIHSSYASWRERSCCKREWLPSRRLSLHWHFNYLRSMPWLASV